MSRVVWTPEDFRIIGFLGDMLDDADPRPAREQFDTAYAHGGGWNAFNGFTLHDDDSISYPGDPSFKPAAWAKLRDETILLYPYGWVAIIQPDRSFEVCRMD